MKEYSNIIKILKEILNNNQFSDDEIEAINVAIDVINLQIPKHTIEKYGFYERVHGKLNHHHEIEDLIPYNYNEIYYNCPNCDNTFGWYYASKYCNQCGQRVFEGGRS